MNNDKTQNIKESHLYPIVELERFFSQKARHTIGTLTIATVFLFGLFISLSYLVQYAQTDVTISSNITTPINLILPRVIGLTFILLAFWLFVYALESYFRSLYFKEDHINPNKDEISITDLYSFQVLRILTKKNSADITKTFLESNEGSKIMTRCGLTNADRQQYLKERNSQNIYPEPSISEYQLYTLKDLVQYIFESDEEFAEFLFSKGILPKHLHGSAEWVYRNNKESISKARWWSKENLEKIGGLGADFAYGEAYLLKRYGQEIFGSKAASKYHFTTEKNQDDILELKSILSRSRESNAILVGEQGGGKISLLYAFASDVFHGKVPVNLERKIVIMLNSTTLIASSKQKDDLETLLLRIMNDAINAGNIILVFDDFPAFMQSATVLGVDIIKLLDPYFDSSQIQIIILSDTENFHQNLEQNTQIMGRFERIYVTPPDEDESIIVLQHVAEELEKRYGVRFTYNSIVELVINVKNYFQDPIMPDKAIDIAVELPARVKLNNRNIITKKDVLSLISKKTNIPTGEIADEERDKLLNLEKLLHNRVIGQHEAVKAVSSSMRRSRSGVRSMKRPIGSFLFIGPTGVGKTETAKTLADVFFGSEAQMQRIDMSEYRGEDALSRLIGSNQTGQVGTLTKIIKEHPYGVLLLDEFEKTNPNIHDLFLQILDEGFYSDMHGKKVNARNIIFIATSNAGSELIWEYMDKGIDLTDAKRDIIDHLVNTGKFRPEFLNRFDAVVLYHPLELEHIEQIAGLMIKSLAKRLKKKGLDLQTTPELIKFIAKEGYDRVFGARPMTRYIQEHIEQLIADKIIKGEIKQGTHFTLTPDDLQSIPKQAESYEEIGQETSLPTTNPTAQNINNTPPVNIPNQQKPIVTPPTNTQPHMINQAPVQAIASIVEQQTVQPQPSVLPTTAQPMPQPVPTPIPPKQPSIINDSPIQPHIINKSPIQTQAVIANKPTRQELIPQIEEPQIHTKPIELATLKYRGPQFTPTKTTTTIKPPKPPTQ